MPDVPPKSLRRHRQSRPRRRFLGAGGALALGLLAGSRNLYAEEFVAAAPAASDIAVEPVGCAVIGLGEHGRALLAALGNVPSANVLRLCDSYEAAHKRALEIVPKATAVASPTTRRCSTTRRCRRCGWRRRPTSTRTSSSPRCRPASTSTARRRWPTASTTPAPSPRRRWPPTSRSSTPAYSSAPTSSTCMRSSSCAPAPSLRSLLGRGPLAPPHLVASHRRQRRAPEGAQLAPETGDLESRTDGRDRHPPDRCRQLVPQCAARARSPGFGGIKGWRDGREVHDTVHCLLEYPDDLHFAYDATLVNSVRTATARPSRAARRRCCCATIAPGCSRRPTRRPSAEEVYAFREKIGDETGIALVADATKILAAGKQPGENRDLLDPRRTAIVCAERGLPHRRAREEAEPVRRAARVLEPRSPPSKPTRRR